MEQGLYVMAVGMGTVFTFLGAMVLVMKGAALFFSRFPEDDIQATQSAVSSAGGAIADDESRRIAIAVAVAVATAWRNGYRPDSHSSNDGGR